MDGNRYYLQCALVNQSAIQRPASSHSKPRPLLTRAPILSFCQGQLAQRRASAPTASHKPLQNSSYMN